MNMVTVYAIDRDNGEGYYERRYSFEPFTGPGNITDGRGLVVCQDTDAGRVGEIVLPEGCRADFESDTLATVVTVPGPGPNRTTLNADEAVAAARAGQWGLRFNTSA